MISSHVSNSRFVGGSPSLKRGAHVARIPIKSKNIISNSKGRVRMRLSSSLATVLSPYVPSLMGGLSLGVLSVGRLMLSGKVLGISGTVKGILEGDRSTWRICFLAGLLGGGTLLGAWYPAAFDSSASSLSISRIVASGLLVGAGTALGNGCTSGHGICGNARLSGRSFVSTLTFMACGTAAAAAFSTAAIQGVPSGIITPPAPTPELISKGALILGSSVTMVAAMSAAASSISSAIKDAQQQQLALTWLERAADIGTGVLFALGLGLSGMTQPSKVSSFLSFLSGTFDPSLMFVMGGALLVALPGYQLILRSSSVKKPLFAPTFSLPSSKVIDWRLLTGAALFGAGWGAAGLCPGPALVSVATLAPANLAFAASLVVGMLLARTADSVSSRA